MAVKNGSKKVSEGTPKSKDGVQFVNYDLTAEDKVRFKAWAHENAGQEAFDIVLRVVESGFNVSLKYSEFEGCHVAFLIPQGQHAELKDWILAGRGSTPFSALMGALFRHLVLFDASWPIRSDRKRDLDDDF